MRFWPLSRLLDHLHWGSDNVSGEQKIQLQVHSMLLRLLPREPRQCSELTGRADTCFILWVSAQLLKYAKHKQFVWYRTLHVPVPKLNFCCQVLAGHIKAWSPKKKGNWLVATWRRSLREGWEIYGPSPVSADSEDQDATAKGWCRDRACGKYLAQVGSFCTKFIHTKWEKCSCAGWNRKKAMVFVIWWPFLGGGFKYFLFSPLFGEDSHFD